MKLPLDNSQNHVNANNLKVPELGLDGVFLPG